LAAPHIYTLAHITSVHLRLRGEQDARRAAGVVASIPRIKNLAINAEHCREWYAALIFGTCSSAPRFPRLKSLLLKRFNFELCGLMLARVIDYKQLNELQLIACHNI
jgi:hypothetical protein